MQIQVVGEAYVARNRINGTEECTNLYPEIDRGGKVVALLGVPGIAKESELSGPTNIRALYTASNGHLYGVQGDLVYRVLPTLIPLATLDTTDGYTVQMSDNGIQLIVVDGDKGVLIDLSTFAVTDITDADFPKADSVTCINHRFIVNETEGTQDERSRFYVSGLLDGTDWGAYATAEGTPDPLLTIAGNGENLWLFGTESTEVWYDTGVGSPSFARIPGGHSDIGCGAKRSVARLGDNFFWLGDEKNGRGAVYTNEGYVPRKISTHAIEYQISQLPNVADAMGYCYREEGHSFYVLVFPEGERAYCHDVDTGLWHERAGVSDTHEKIAPAGVVYAAYGGLHLLGSRHDGKIYRQSLDIHDNAGDPIRRVRVTPVIDTGYRRMRHEELILAIDTGVGLEHGQGSDPTAVMQYSDDGGVTWSYEIPARFGAKGEYSHVAKWTRLGISRRRAYKITISDPVPVAITGAELRVTATE